ncbi:hypothetical protein LWI29_019240 [Acer saccharum]|uniref:Uncharacterized protein n=1 Tax=Acer saccharum TaxID=4024 RepID=A0AA39S779_ACESA|nr:hypothetical protein LWI29_019240 [Acer saccharum]
MALATRQRRPGLPSDLPSSPTYTKFNKKSVARSDGGDAPEDDRAPSAAVDTNSVHHALASGLQNAVLEILPRKEFDLSDVTMLYGSPIVVIDEELRRRIWTLEEENELLKSEVKARKNLDKEFEFELEVGTVLDMDSIPSVAGVSQQRVAVCSVKDTISNNLGQTIIKGPVIRQVEPQGSFSHLPKSYSEEINDLRGQKVILGLGVRT